MKKEAKKTEQLVFRVTKEMAKMAKVLKINIAQTCREALQREIDVLKRQENGGASHGRENFG